MANTDSLVSLFEDFNISDVLDKHILVIEYPVRGLLPSGVEPLLKPPARLDCREALPYDQRRAGVYQSACRVHLSTERRDNPIDGFPDMLISQHSAFDSMTCGPGTSLLEAVTFYDDGYEEEVIRLCLHVSLKQDAEDHDYTFELSRKQWQKMVDEGGRLWVEALDELMMRRSDRAYYHVRNRISSDYGEGVAMAEEAKWSAGWGGHRLRKEERDDTTVEDIDQMMEVVGL
jgi:hypothetical protein